MKRFLLVDGSNLLFQMFFGMPSRIVNGDGRAIHGTLGFAGAMRSRARMTAPAHIAVLFDGEHENGRKELLPAYKAGRRDFTDAADDDNPFSQLPDIYRMLDTLGCFHTEITDHEADDAIASCAMRFGGMYEVIVASQDSDLFQLVTEDGSVKYCATVGSTAFYVMPALCAVASACRRSGMRTTKPLSETPRTIFRACAASDPRPPPRLSDSTERSMRS